MAVFEYIFNGWNFIFISNSSPSEFQLVKTIDSRAACICENANYLLFKLYTLKWNPANELFITIIHCFLFMSRSLFEKKSKWNEKSLETRGYFELYCSTGIYIRRRHMRISAADLDLTRLWQTNEDGNCADTRQRKYTRAFLHVNLF